MLVQIGVRAPSDDDVVGLVWVVHRRIESRLGDLLCAAGQLSHGEQAVRQQACSGLDRAMASLRRAAHEHQLHEAALFSSLLSKLEAWDSLARLCHALEEDRQALHSLLGQIELLTESGLRGKPSQPMGRAIEHSVRRLHQTYRDHLRTVEDLVLPHTPKILDGGELAALGQEMRMALWPSGNEADPASAPGLP